MRQFDDQPPNAELEAAFAYALALAPALPLDPTSKRPLIAHGYYSASADRVELARWWRKWPNALFALRTGLPGGIAVLDLDPRHGVDLAIADRYATRKHRTRSAESTRSFVIGQGCIRRPDGSRRALTSAPTRAASCGGQCTGSRCCVRDQSRSGRMISLKLPGGHLPPREKSVPRRGDAPLVTPTSAAKPIVTSI